MYAPETEIKAQLKFGTTVTFTTSLVNVHCTGSTMKGFTSETGGANGLPLEGTLTELTFTGCKTTSGANCTVTTVGVSGTEIARTSFTRSGSGNGTLRIKRELAGQNPGAKVVCGFLINCTLQASPIELDADGGNPALLTAIGEPLERSGGICPKEALWDATYEVTAPKPLFLT
jgi:hypothetical protein